MGMMGAPAGPARRAANNSAIGQTQALIAASQNAANRGDFAAAKQLQNQANAAFAGVTSSGARGAIGSALDSLNKNVSDPAGNVARGGGGYAPPPPPPAPPKTPQQEQARKAAANNQAIGKSQALIAAANKAQNQGNFDLANKLIDQAKEEQKNVLSKGAKEALKAATPPKVQRATLIPLTPEGDDEGGDEEPVVRQPTVNRPTAPISSPSAPSPKIVKNPNRDVLDLSRDEFSVSSVSRLLFEQVGSIELVNIARRDTIEGQNPYYSMISNLSTVRKNFDPTSIITRQKSNQGIYSNYTISLNDKIPDDQYLERNNLTDFYYIDDNGDLVIELDNLASDEIIDFEIAESGTINLVDEA